MHLKSMCLIEITSNSQAFSIALLAIQNSHFRMPMGDQEWLQALQGSITEHCHNFYILKVDVRGCEHVKIGLT